MKRNLLATVPDLTRSLNLLHRVRPATTVPAGTRPKLTAPRGERGRQLAVTEVYDHLTFTATTVTAWFTVEPVVWPFRGDAAREADIESHAAQYAKLAGREIHLRRTSVPFDVDTWVNALDGNANPLPPAAADTGERIVDLGAARDVDASWTGHLSRVAARLHDGDYAVNRTHLGVVLDAKGCSSEHLPADVDQQLAELVEDLAAGGLHARPATTSEISWLIYRSVGIGLTPPDFVAGDVSPDDVAEFGEFTDWIRDRYDTTTQIVDRRTGHSVHAAVLTVGRMEELDIPAVHEPWLHVAAQMPFPVEVSSRMTVLDSAASSGDIQLRLRMLVAQQQEYAEHGLPEPPELGRLAARAAEIGDQIDTCLPVDACRLHGWHRLAVYGATRDECLARSRALTRAYADRLHVSLVPARGQAAQLREFIPGEPAADLGHLRRLPVRHYATAVPQAVAVVGDNRGDLIGFTATGGESPVFFDPHFPMEVRERSGLIVAVAEPGGGKSTLMGTLAYLNALRGVRVTVMDPSGPLTNLCRMPELAPYSRIINLTGSQPGTLAPYAMIPHPKRTAFEPGPDGDQEHADAVDYANADRMLLVLDICQMLLPPQILADPRTVTELRAAVRGVPAVETSRLEDVALALYNWGETDHAKTIADLLFDMARLPMGRLFFGRPPADALSSDALFTVISMAGIQLPDFTTSRVDWSVQEMLAVPALYLANRLAVRRTYSGDQTSRKLVGLDEGHIISRWPSGRAFLNRLSRDSRKWNIAAVVASQDPADILDLAMQNLVTTTFVGRIAEDADVAAGALRMLNVPVGAGYEATLAALSQYSTTTTSRLGYREFVMRDVDNRVQKIRVELDHYPGLLAALDTTPGSR